MTKQRSSKRALLLSVLSLLLCVSMLVGTTYAWFTDEVVSGMNTIAAGNLDVELLANNVTVETTTKLFDDATLWEPGVVVYENLQVVNAGTLALQYQMALNFGSENDLNGKKLSEILKVAVLDTTVADNADRAAVLADAKAAANVGSLQAFKMQGELKAGESSAAQAVVIFWEPNANEIDNLYNANNGKPTSDGEPLHIEFGVNLQAIQLMHEEDSFGKDYDAKAQLPTYVTNEAELEAVTEVGGLAVLGNDFEVSNTIDLNGAVIDGNGYTLTFTKGGSGVVMFNPTGGTVKNVKIVDPNASFFDNKYVFGSNQYASSTLTEDLYIENVEISGFKFSIDVNADGNSVYVKDSEIVNWVQVAKADVTYFEGCHFKADAAAQMQYNKPDQQAILFLLGDMTFVDCHFEENVNFYLDSTQFSGTVEFENSTYGNNGVEDRPIDSFGFVQYWFPATGVYGYAGTFGDTKPAQTHFNWIIDGTLVWDATAI